MLPGSRPRTKRSAATHQRVTRLIEQGRGDVTFLVLSPATDLAKLIGSYPTVLKRTREIVFVSGRSPGDRFYAKSGGKEVRDMNYVKDRLAYKAVLPLLYDKGIKTTFVGFRAAMNTTVPNSFMPVGFAQKAQQAWHRKTRFWFGTRLPPFDVVAAMAVSPYHNRLRCRYVNIRAGDDLILSSTQHSYFTFCD
ncbi:nucleoside hydrolase [Roseovarius tolerans]